MRKMFEILVSSSIIVAFIIISVIGHIRILSGLQVKNKYSDPCIDLLSDMYENNSSYIARTQGNSSLRIIYIYSTGIQDAEPVLIILITKNMSAINIEAHIPANYTMMSKYRVYGGGWMYCFVREEAGV